MTTRRLVEYFRSKAEAREAVTLAVKEEPPKYRGK